MYLLQDNYPLVKANFEKVKQLPAIKAYLENRPESQPPGL
jgi:hypothetical protein